MIGTFWNLCRACPAIPSDKGRSEYRSTYQWYEYTGARQQDVVKHAPQLLSPTKYDDLEIKIGFLPSSAQNNSMANNKDDIQARSKEADEGLGAVSNKPEVNIKKNPVYGKKEYDNSSDENANFQNGVRNNPAIRVRSRNGKRDYTPSRRSKSEGPPSNSKKRHFSKIYGYPSPDYALGDSELMDFDPEYVVIQNYQGEESNAINIPLKNLKDHTEYRLQFAWPKNKNQSEVFEEQKGNRKPIHMASPGERFAVPVHKKRMHDTAKHDGVPELEPLVNQNDDGSRGETIVTKTRKPEKRTEFHSEYKKNFRPFSQYDYIAGKFLPKENEATLVPSDIPKVGGGTWYEEVIEMRKKAGEYKHRGWGTELVPEHLAEVYNKQIALWEHVSRRSSLSALTLATTTQKPRALTKDEKGKENFKKAIPGRPREVTSYTGRPVTAENSFLASHKKAEKPDKNWIKGKKDFPAKHSSERATSITSGSTTPSTGSILQPSMLSGRSHSVGPGSSSKKNITGHAMPGKTAAEGRLRPTTLATSAHYGVKLVERNMSDRKKATFKPHNLPVTIVAPTASARIHNKDTNKLLQPVGMNATVTQYSDDQEDSSIGIDILDSGPIIKSPPEPTRVKSPEQMMIRSPEPVNWTVPLDTGKMFTVTQNIQLGNRQLRFGSDKSGSPTRVMIHTSGDALGAKKLATDGIGSKDKGEYGKSSIQLEKMDIIKDNNGKDKALLVDDEKASDLTAVPKVMSKNEQGEKTEFQSTMNGTKSTSVSDTETDALISSSSITDSMLNQAEQFSGKTEALGAINGKESVM